MLGALVTGMLLQAAIISGPPLPSRQPAAPARPLSPVPTTPCPKGANGDIVVCGSTDANERYRLRPLPERYVDEQRLQMKLGGNATLGSEIQQGRLGDGQVMLTLKVPF